MSALGQKRILAHLRLMSALPPKADIGTHPQNVRFVPKADSCSAASKRPLLAMTLPRIAWPRFIHCDVSIGGMSNDTVCVARQTCGRKSCRA